MKRIIIFLVASGFWASHTLLAQVDSATTALDSKVEVYMKENIPFKKPIPFAHVREADVLWERVVWREIDLRQRQNFPLYFPTNPKVIGSRKNFFTLLMEGVERGEITPYNPFPLSDEFAEPITYETILANPSLIEDDKTETQLSLDGMSEVDVVIKGRNLLEQDNIQRIMVKEKVYFDRRHSRLERRVIGLMPVFIIPIEGSTVPRRIPVMWIYMPEARPLLSRHTAYNPNNEAQQISYDDFFMQHMYRGEIIRVGNIFNNRRLDEYTTGLDTLYEAQRIENEIFDWEQDLWEY